MLLSELLITTKDGDWGADSPQDGFVPYRVIRGADFPEVRLGDSSTVPIRFLDSNAVLRRTLQPNDIIIETAGGNRDRPTGRTILVTERLLNSLELPATCASFCRFLRVEPNKADPRFVYWYLQHLYEQGEMWQHQVQHTGVARFQYTRFAETTDIPIPELAEQRAIAEFLSNLDDKIEVNRRTNSTLAAIARAIFKSWFVDFDPIRSKAEVGRTVTLNPELGALFPDTLTDSQIGQIPTGWNLTKLSDLCKVGRGASPRPITDPRFLGGPIPWIKISDATSANGPFLYETKEGLTEEGRDRSVFLEAGELILSNSATCGLPIFLELAGCIHDGWLYFKRLETISKYYLFHTLEHLSEHLVHIADGSVQKNLNTSLVGSQLIVVPNERIRNQFDSIVHPMFEKIRLNGHENRSLTAIRLALLAKLFSGEVRLNTSQGPAEKSVLGTSTTRTIRSNIDAQ